MGMYAVSTTIPAVSESVVWEDVVDLQWPGPDGPCEILASFHFRQADARIIVRQGTFEVTLIGGLGDQKRRRVFYNLCEGDVAVLQFRAWTPTTPAAAGPSGIVIRSLPE